METDERATVRVDKLEAGTVVLAVKNPTHDPCWRQVAAVYRNDVPLGDRPGLTSERWQVWFEDAEYPMGMVYYGDHREFKVGTDEDLGTEPPK